MIAWRRWWSVTGSDPVWWLILPLLLLLVALFGPFWIAAWAIRRMEDWPDWLEDFGAASSARLLEAYRPRRERRVAAWKAKRAAQLGESQT